VAAPMTRKGRAALSPSETGRERRPKRSARRSDKFRPSYAGQTKGITGALLAEIEARGEGSARSSRTR